MKVSIFLLANIIILTLSQRCPSDKWSYCTVQGDNNYCRIADNIKQGYMSLGINGRWTLIPFSNDVGHNDMTVWCQLGSGGNPMVGVTKHCCYIAADIDMPDINENNLISYSDGTKHMSREERVTLSDSSRYWTFRHGIDGRFLYRIGFAAPIVCTTGFFGDITSDAAEICQGVYGSPDMMPTIDSNEWILCANEGDECNGLDKNVPQWIKYGDNNQYYFRLIISHDGKIACNDDLFTELVEGNTGEYCWRSSKSYKFSNIAGKWELIEHCHGCPLTNYKYSVGVTALTEEERGETWSKSFSTEVSAGFSFGPFSASGGVSKEEASEVSTSMSTAFEQTASETIEWQCDKGNLYQWTLSSTSQSPLTLKPFKVKGTQLACIGSGYEPKCLPNTCEDDNCQQCKS